METLWQQIVAPADEWPPKEVAANQEGDQIGWCVCCCDCNSLTTQPIRTARNQCLTMSEQLDSRIENSTNKGNQSADLYLYLYLWLCILLN